MPYFPTAGKTSSQAKGRIRYTASSIIQSSIDSAYIQQIILEIDRSTGNELGGEEKSRRKHRRASAKADIMARPKHQAPPPPPYTPSYPSLPSTGTRNLSNLPLPVLFQIISYTLDPRSTPNRWVSDIAEERVRRIWGLFIGLRGVCRSFWLGKLMGS